MFTGIVEEVGKVISAPAGGLVIAAREVLHGMKPGASIAVNGACLTVTGFTNKSFAVDVMPETLRRTNLGRLRTGDAVNLERPLALGGQLGGHLVQGHVDGTGTVAAIAPEGDALLMRFTAPPEVLRYAVARGFIAVDGISLTIAAKDTDSFSVAVVDYTRTHTTLGDRKAGDVVNLEIDIIAKYVEQFTHTPSAGITAEFLREHGFMVN